MITFALAVFFLIVTPGPGVLSAAGVGSAFGAATGLRYLAGLFAGTNLVALAVVLGYAALVLSLPALRLVLLLASSAYLFYLALHIALAGRRIAFVKAVRAPGFRDGVALQAINPKAYVVNTALFTGFPLWLQNPLGETLLKFLIINLIWIPIHLLWLSAGVHLHRLNLQPAAHRLINALMAAAMLAVVALALWSMPPV